MFICLLASASALTVRVHVVFGERVACATVFLHLPHLGNGLPQGLGLKTLRLCGLKKEKKKSPRRWTTTLQSLSPDFSVSFFFFFFFLFFVLPTEETFMMLLNYVHRDRMDAATSMTFTHLLSTVCLVLQFTSTETVGTIRTSSWRPTTSTSIFTQFLSCVGHTHCACETFLRQILKLHGSTIRNVACFSPSGKVKPHVVSVS